MAESTKKKILKIVKELDYQPNYLASTLASKKSAVFATLLPLPPSIEGYWNKPVVGINKRINELTQYGVEVKPFTFNQFDSKSFGTEAEKILELKPDGVILAPFFIKESKQFIEQLKKLSIPFVFIDSEIKNTGQLSYIGQDSFQSGLVAGKLLDILVDKNKSIIVIHFAKEMDNQNHLMLREKGFYHWFSKNGKKNRRLLTCEISNGESDSWQEKILDKIEQNNIGGLFVTNSKVFYAARLIQKYKLKKLKVIGHDLLNENVEYLKKEVVQFLICQKPEEQGYNAINKLFRNIVQKREVEKENYTSIDIITKENVDYYKDLK
ncbi:MAG: substrate-binding domain-containing protein [Mariniphaga sp.]|nr:substrate-binding domain-containing protein [Mariniphaga sp.]